MECVVLTVIDDEPLAERDSWLQFSVNRSLGSQKFISRLLSLSTMVYIGMGECGHISFFCDHCLHVLLALLSHGSGHHNGHDGGIQVRNDERYHFYQDIYRHTSGNHLVNHGNHSHTDRLLMAGHHDHGSFPLVE